MSDMEVTRDLLLIEDNPGDARLVEETFQHTSHADALHVVTNGAEALDFVYGRGDYAESPRPNLILLDWSLPKVDAADILAEIKTEQGIRQIPVIVLSGISSPKEILRAYDHRANAFIEKSTDPEEVERMLKQIDEFWFSIARLPALTESEESN